MSLFLFAFSALSVIYSVDFGSDNVKLGIALPGRIEVALNMQSKRYTPSYFALYNISNKQKTKIPEHWNENQTRELEWLFAYDAQSHGKRFPQNVVKGMPDLFKNTKGLTGRELYALELKHLVSTAADGKFSFEKSKLMVAVEPWMSRKERVAIKEAIEIGESSLAGIIDSPTAAATTYALERQLSYLNSSKTVAFLDLGHNHTWVSIFNFSSNGTKLSAQQLSVDANMTLGGYIIDETLANIFMEKFAKQYNLDLPFSERVQHRFLDEARRAKERLTVSPTTSANIEDVVDDYCFSFKLEREYFDTLFNSTSESLNRLLDSALTKANMTKDQLDSIELLGGTTRVPFINESVRAWSGMEKLNRTMNSDEAIAIGAGYAGAATSAAFIIQHINMSSFCGVNTSFITPEREYPLFQEKTPQSEHIFVNFTAKELPKNITLHVDGEGDFFTYELKLPEGINETENITLEFGFSDITIPVLWDAQWNRTRLNCTVYKPSWMLTKNETEASRDFLHDMDYVLWKRIDKLKLRNDHEALTYKLRDRIESDLEFLSVITEEEKMNISRAIEEHQEWANNETEKKSRRILREKLTQLERLTDDPELRLREIKNRPEAFEKLNNTINETKSALLELPNTKPWISTDNYTSLRKVLNETITWFEDKLKEVAAENRTQNPIIRVSDINSKRWNLSDELDKIRNIPKPKPVINITNSTDTNATISGESINGTFINGSTINVTSDSNVTNETIPETINSNQTIPETTGMNQTIPETINVNETIPEASNINATASNQTENVQSEANNATKPEENVETEKVDQEL